MKDLSDLRFFRLLSEHSQKEFAVNDFTAALQELANHLVSIAIKEQDYAVLLRYFSFGLSLISSKERRYWSSLTDCLQSPMPTEFCM